VIDNGGEVDALDAQIERAWAWIHRLPDGVPTRLLTAEPGSAT
jgi:hypothetical protein